MTGIATTQLSTLTEQQHTAAQTAVVAPLSPLAPEVTLESIVSALSWPANGARPSKQKWKLCEQPSNWYRRTNRGYHLSFSWCPIYSEIRGNYLADVAAKERTTVEQEGVSHHYDSANAAIRQANKEPLLPTSVNVQSTAKEVKKEPQVGKPTVVKEGPSLHQQIEVRPSRGFDILAPQDRQNARYCQSEMWHGEETVEHAIGECPRSHHPTARLPDPFIIATNPHKALDLRELWKAKPDLPGISHPAITQQQLK